MKKIDIDIDESTADERETLLAKTERHIRSFVHNHRAKITMVLTVSAGVAVGYFANEHKSDALRATSEGIDDACDRIEEGLEKIEDVVDTHIRDASDKLEAKADEIDEN